MSDKRISQLVERVTIANNDVLPIVALNAATTNKVTISTIQDWMQTNLNMGVTSVALTLPTGLSVTGSPITSTGTFVVSFTAGYSIPTTAKQTQWDTAYTNRITSATAPLGIASNVISITQSGASTDGYLSSTDWNTFNNKQSTITTGNLTEATSSVLTITGGTGAVLGSGTSIQVKQASGSQDGFLDSADWTTFNDKQNALSGTGIVKSTGGTISYLTDNTSNWDSAYNDKINSAAVTGTTTKTLTLTQQDGGTITASWTDINTDAVTSVFGRTGAVVAVSGDYDTDKVTEGTTNLYFTNARSRSSISLTTTGTSGAASYNSTTGVLNIPQYQSVITNPVTGTGTTNTLPKFTGASTIGNSNITDTGSLITLGSNTNVNGALGIGTSSLNGRNLLIDRVLTGTTTSISVFNISTIASDVTTNASSFRSSPSTQAASFTLAALNHFQATNATIGSGSSVTTQVGFSVTALSSATNNYGFQGQLASGTGRYNLYIDGTAENYLAGNTGIGGLASYISSGPILTLTLTNGGSGYVDGTYTDVATTLVSSTGAGALFTIVVSGGVVTSATLTWGGSLYKVNDTISVSNTLLGGTGSGLIITINTVDSSQLTITNANGADITLFKIDATLNPNDNIGTIKWLTNDTTVKASGIVAEIGAFGESTNGGATLRFYTRAGVVNSPLVEAMRVAGTGGVGIGATTLTGYSLRVSKSITGATSAFGIVADGEIQSGVTSTAINFRSIPSTAAASFTLTNLYHYTATNGTLGSGSAITNQYGYWVSVTFANATNNYAFYSDLGAGTNRWNLYMAGTANNYLAGNLLVGTNTDAGYKLDVNGSGMRLKNSGGSADFLLDRGSTSAGATYQYLTGGTLKWYTGLRGLANDNFYLFNNATSTNTLIFDVGTNAATFSSSVTTGSTVNINAVAWLQFNSANVLLGEGTNTYLQANGGGSIIFRNNTPSTLLTIANSGAATFSSSVGIGGVSATSVGGTAFMVYDSATPRIRLTNSTTGTTSTDGSELSLFNSDFNIENRESGAMNFYVNGGLRQTITSSGNVEYRGSSSSANADIRQLGFINTANSGNVKASIVAVNGADSDDMSLSFRTSTSAANISEKLKIAGNGAATFSSSITANASIVSNRTKSGAGVESWDGIALRLLGANAVGDSIGIKFINAGGTHIANIQGIFGADNVAYGSLAFSTRNYFTDSMVEMMRITNRNQVLINTNTGVSGGGTLQVNGNVNINGVFQINGTTIGGGGGSGVSGSGTTNTIPLWTGSSSLGNSLIKQNDSAEIQIQYSPTQGQLRLGGGNGAGNSRLYFESNGDNSYIDSYGNSAYQNLLISTKNLSINQNGAFHSKFNSSGVLEIGITGQDGKRLIVGHTSTTSYNPNSYNGVNGLMTMQTGNATSAYSTIRFCGGGSHEGLFGTVQTASGLGDFIWQGYNGANYGEMMRIHSSTRNLSIGTSSDNGYRLNVSGTIYASGDVIAYSDIKIKTNIRPIENALEKISNSRGVIYDRTDNDDKNNIGFIAQELEKQFPELVSTDNNGNKGVKYQNAVAVLFEAIKEQQKQIDGLKKQIS